SLYEMLIAENKVMLDPFGVQLEKLGHHWTHLRCKFIALVLNSSKRKVIRIKVVIDPDLERLLQQPKRAKKISSVSANRRILAMNITLLERIPVEIWEKILYHATFSPLLPVTEDGELTPDLVDNLLLFEDHCRMFDVYRVQTQALVERLRLVCRLWAKLLRPRTNELSLATLREYYYPSFHGTLFSTRL
ncbi:11720_t:CDS:2, partial [Acaulospora colombiana]